MLESDRNAIRERAYFIWLREGRPEGRAQDHWRSATLEEFSQNPTRMLNSLMKRKFSLAAQTRIFRRC